MEKNLHMMHFTQKNFFKVRYIYILFNCFIIYKYNFQKKTIIEDHTLF